MKLFSGSVVTKAIVLVTACLITSCAIQGSESADISECRKIAYGNHSDTLKPNAEQVFSQCSAEKKALRAKANSEETTAIWLEFLFELFAEPSSNKK